MAHCIIFENISNCHEFFPLKNSRFPTNKVTAANKYYRIFSLTSTLKPSA